MKSSKRNSRLTKRNMTSFMILRLKLSKKNHSHAAADIENFITTLINLLVCDNPQRTALNDRSSHQPPIVQLKRL